MEINIRDAVKQIRSTAIRGVVDQLGRIGVLDKFGSNVRQNFQDVVRVQGLTPEFTSRFIDLTAQGSVPLMYAGHFIHIDANFMAEGFHALQGLAQNSGLGENLTSAVITIAKSVSNGRQDRFMQRMFPYMEGHANDRNVIFVEVTREKDVEKYGMDKKTSEARPLVAKLRQRGTAAIVFPYGSIEAGRTKESGHRGEINGLMRLVDPKDGEPKTDLFEMYQAMESLGRRTKQTPYFLPVGLSRSYKVQNPDNYLPTLEAILSLYDKPSRILRFFGLKRLIVDVTFGMPITAEMLEKRFSSSWKEHFDEVNDFLMEQVAQLVIPSERGEYSYIQ